MLNGDFIRSIKVVQPYDELEKVLLQNSIAVVIDILRASTTIVTAIENGCKQIIPVVTVEEAFEQAELYPKEERLVCGERHGHPVKGFDLGNSPSAYTRNVVENKTIILTTSNGTKALNRAKDAIEAVVISFRNFNAVVEHLLSSANNIVVLCSGTNSQNSLEDDVCAGMVIKSLLQQKPNSFECGKVEHQIFQQSLVWEDNLLGMLRQSQHGKYLINQGFEKDLDFCAQKIKSQTIPKLIHNKII